jgi:hypothetical protein
MVERKIKEAPMDGHEQAVAAQSAPLIGISISLACFVASIALSRT